MSLSQDNTILSFVKLTDLLEGQSIFVKEKPTVLPYHVFLSSVSPLLLTENVTSGHQIRVFFPLTPSTSLQYGLSVLICFHLSSGTYLPGDSSRFHRGRAQTVPPFRCQSQVIGPQVVHNCLLRL